VSRITVQFSTSKIGEFCGKLSPSHEELTCSSLSSILFPESKHSKLVYTPMYLTQIKHPPYTNGFVVCHP
jgi:hypothetical protein